MIGIEYVSALIFCATVYVYYHIRSRRGRLTDLPGPEPHSFLLGELLAASSLCICRLSDLIYLTGNLKDLFQQQVGACEFKWQEQYGNVVRIKSTLGVSRPPRFNMNRPRPPLTHTMLLLIRVIYYGWRMSKRCNMSTTRLGTTIRNRRRGGQCREYILGMG